MILERGRFTAADTAATAAALQFYALGLLAYSVVRIVSPIFYALGRSRTPVTISVMTVLVNAGLNVMLVRRSVSADWRSAPRSLRCSTPPHCSPCSDASCTEFTTAGSSAHSCASEPQPARWVSSPRC